MRDDDQAVDPLDQNPDEELSDDGDLDLDDAFDGDDSELGEE